MAAIRLRKTRRTSALTGHWPKSSVRPLAAGRDRLGARSQARWDRAGTPAARGHPFRFGPRTEVADPQHCAPLDPKPRSASSRAIEPGVKGISGRAPHEGARIRAGSKFRHVGLAENDCARLAYMRDHGRIVCGHVAAIERRAVGRQEPCGLVEILDAGRQAVQWAELLALAGG